jgi:disease resistance protein RPM1
MQMEITTGVMSSLLLKMAELLTDEYSLQRGLRGEVMFLKAELESMQAAMERVSEAPVNDNQVNIWASEVRELSYDIEDSIDQFMVRVNAHPSTTPEGFKGFIARSLRLLAEVKTRHQISTEIRDMRTLVKEVAERRNRYKVDSSVTTASTAPEIDRRLHGFYEESAKLVAISGPREELAELLMVREGASKKLKVISIVGVGGLGKTTLANVVYRQLRGQFECNAFVSVSLKPDLKRILSSILRQVSEQIYTNIETWDVVEIINKIRQVLEHKR